MLVMLRVSSTFPVHVTSAAGTRISLYEQLKLKFTPFKGTPHGTSVAAITTSTTTASNSSSSSTLLPKLMFGLISGGVGQLVAVPADLIKVCTCPAFIAWYGFGTRRYGYLVAADAPKKP